MIDPVLAEKLAFLFGGMVAGLAGAVFAMSKDTAFIKGQLTEVIRVIDAFKKVSEHVAILDKEHLKTRLDLNHAHEKIRRIENATHDS